MTWEGNRALRKLLTPVGELRPHPRNPRLGNVYEIGLSLERFGQQRPVLALPDGTIIAGHHVYQAAVAREWTHVAVIRSDLTDDEVDGYLLADNGTADRGYYDETQLATLLGQWEDTAGTGFSTDLAFRLRDHSLLMFDGQALLHGVSPFRITRPDGHRFTVVFYSLKQMWRCETRDESVALAASRRTARERQRFA